MNPTYGCLIVGGVLGGYGGLSGEMCAGEGCGLLGWGWWCLFQEYGQRSGADTGRLHGLMDREGFFILLYC